MIIFLFGKEDFLALEKIRELEKKFQEKNPIAKMDIFDVEGDSFDGKKLTESLQQGGGLFSSKKLIVLKNILSLNATQQEQLLKILDPAIKDSLDISLIIQQSEIKDKRNKLYKFLSKQKQAYEFSKLDGLKLKGWVQKAIAQRSKEQVQIEMSALERLTLITKGNLWQLDQEIEKLVNYFDLAATGQKTINLSLINLLCQGEVESKIFDLVDALAARNKARSHQLVQALLDQGENEFYIFTMIIYQFRNLVRIVAAQQKIGPNPAAISQKLKLHPFVVKKSLAQLRNFPLTHLKTIYSLAADIDHQVKIGEKTMNEALTYFIAKI